MIVVVTSMVRHRACLYRSLDDLGQCERAHLPTGRVRRLAELSLSTAVSERNRHVPDLSVSDLYIVSGSQILWIDIDLCCMGHHGLTHAVFNY
jgi:hypothetical protein